MRGFVCLWLCLLPAVAWGQTVPPLAPQQPQSDRPLPEQPVRQRAQPDFTPPGIRLGGFVLHPSLSLGAAFDDNIDATGDASRADLVTVVEPSLHAESDWSRHQLRLDLGGGYHRYLDHTERSMFASGRVGATGRIDASRALIITGGVGHSWNHEERGSFDDDGSAITPTAFQHTAATAGIRYQPGRFGLDGVVMVDRYRFENGSAADGTTVDNSDRDRMVSTARLTGLWQLHPGFEAFLRGAFDVSHYDRTADDFGNRRDSHSGRVEGGVRFDLTRLLTLHLHAGMFRRDFDGFNDLPGVIGGGNLVWLPTALTTVTLRADRQEVATSVAEASGILLSSAAVAVDHELKRNLILGASLEIARGDFVGIDRTDIQLIAGVDVTYNLDRHVFVNGHYGFRRRGSSVSGYDYERTQFLARVGYRF